MKPPQRCVPFPLYTQVLIAVICGALLGVIFGQEPYLGGLRNEQLGKVGLFVVTLLKTLAIPLIFFAILDALIRTSLPARQGGKLLLICLVNVSVAMTIGLVIMNTWQPGSAWTGHVNDLLHLVPGTKPSAGALASVHAGSQSPIEHLLSYIPRTIMDPFSTSNIIGVVFLALILGAILRHLQGRTRQKGRNNLKPRAWHRTHLWMVGAAPRVDHSRGAARRVRRRRAGGRQVRRGRVLGPVDLPRRHALRVEPPWARLLPARRLVRGEKVAEGLSGPGRRRHHDRVIM